MNPRLRSSGLLACMLGIAAALIVGCGSSSGKLIPFADAGPLQTDFEAIAQAAESGDGECAATKAAIATTEQNFSALPASVDAGLRDTLRQGIDNLRSHALALCAQPLVQTAATSTTPKTPPSTTTTTATTPTTPTNTETSTTPATPPTNTATTPPAGGGTPAPGVGEAAPGVGGGTGAGEGAGAGTPETGAGANPGGSAGGQEAAK